MQRPACLHRGRTPFLPAASPYTALLVLIAGFLWVAPALHAAEYTHVCTRDAETPLHAEPDAKSAVLYKAPAFMAFLLTSRKGSWLAVQDVDGRAGWLQRSKVREQHPCVTVNADDVNVRWAPSEDAKVMFKADRYASFRVVSRKRDWVGVRYYGMTVWVHNSLLWPKE